jgi:hypothetical protein
MTEELLKINLRPPSSGLVLTKAVGIAAQERALVVQ